MAQRAQGSTVSNSKYVYEYKRNYHVTLKAGGINYTANNLTVAKHNPLNLLPPPHTHTCCSNTYYTSSPSPPLCCALFIIRAHAAICRVNCRHQPAKMFCSSNFNQKLLLLTQSSAPFPPACLPASWLLVPGCSWHNQPTIPLPPGAVLVTLLQLSFSNLRFPLALSNFAYAYKCQREAGAAEAEGVCRRLDKHSKWLLLKFHTPTTNTHTIHTTHS